MTLLERITKDHASFQFMAGKTFLWSPKEQVIHYREEDVDTDAGCWSLIHELSHALLQHQTYQTDFELLQMEVAAWSKAQQVAGNYGVVIDPDHIQDCIDTYRDWLYQRSTCPVCTASGLQTDNRTYRCFNCQSTWHVSASRLCRPYRRTHRVAATA